VARGDAKLVLYGPSAKHGAKVKKGFREFVWYIRHKDKLISTHCGLHERARATAELAQYIRNQDVTPSTVTVAEALNYYEEILREHHTKLALKVAKRHINAKLGSHTCAQLTQRDLENYQTARLAEGAAAWTVFTELSKIRDASLKACGHRTWLPPRPETGGKAIKRSQLAKLLHARLTVKRRIPRYNAILFILITVYCCQRKQAVLDLTWTPKRGHGYVDLEAGIIDFRRYGMPQNRKRRAVQPIPRQILVFLRMARARTKDRVFENAMGNRFSSVQKTYEKMRKTAGLAHIRGHDLIHTGLTLRAQTTPQHVLSKFANKSPSTLSRVYLHAELEELEAAANSKLGKRELRDIKRDVSSGTTSK
jgi:hypothetical protein